jgi:membrane fusion protein (multidrug efflux system)
MSTTAESERNPNAAATAAPTNSAAGPSVAPATHPTPPRTNGGNPTRKRGMLAVALVAVLVGAGYGAYHFAVGRNFESTDNAYVQANVVQITPQVGGTVVAIDADETDVVRVGKALVQLDPADARVALDQAEAQLAQTVREVRTLYTNNSALSAQIALREADLARAQADRQRAQDDVDRRAPLVASGAVGREEFNHAKALLAAATSQVNAAQQAVVAAREQLTSNRSLTDNTSVETHPNVQRAAARVREAHLALTRVSLNAPVDGVVARRSVQLGQRVQAGAPLMTVVSSRELWVDANFKEGQIARLRIDQPATLTADVYGGKTVFHGKVAGLGAGTGAAFSVLPAQNATGNWIKVVQRVPVRIVLDPDELAKHPLRVGLSMEVNVDVRDTGGKQLADAPPVERVRAALQAPPTQQDAEADALIRRVIADNLGRPASDATVVASPARIARRGGAAPTIAR